MKNVKTIIPCRFSYVHCWEPHGTKGRAPRYSISAIIPKEDQDTLNIIKAAVDQVLRNEFSQCDETEIQALRLPLLDGDLLRSGDKNYEGCYFLNANSRYQPQVVDQDLMPITERKQVYAGCYGKISVTFYAYEVNGKRGIAAGLGNIQKLRDGEHLGRRMSAAMEFAVPTSMEQSA